MIDPAETIKNFRKLHNLMQKDIADHMYVSAATISTWERKQCRVSAEDFVAIMDFLGYEVVVRKKNPEWKDKKLCNYEAVKTDSGVRIRSK